MKHIILLLSVFFCLFSSLLAQNPYVEQSFPWLNLQVVKDQKIKSIMLATVSAENASVVNQVLLSFDPSGRLVKEETQSGFRHSCEMYYDHHGLLKKVISQYGTSQDSVVYSYDKQNNAFVSQFLSREESGTWSVTETRYVYSGENKLLEIQTSEGSVKVLQPPAKTISDWCQLKNSLIRVLMFFQQLAIFPKPMFMMLLVIYFLIPLQMRCME